MQTIKLYNYLALLVYHILFSYAIQILTKIFSNNDEKYIAADSISLWAKVLN